MSYWKLLVPISKLIFNKYIENVVSARQWNRKPQTHWHRRQQLNNNTQAHCLCEKSRKLGKRFLHPRWACSPRQQENSRHLLAISPSPSTEQWDPEISGFSFRGTADGLVSVLPESERWQVHLDFQTSVHNNFLHQTSYLSRRRPLSSPTTEARFAMSWGVSQSSAYVPPLSVV